MMERLHFRAPEDVEFLENEDPECRDSKDERYFWRDSYHPDAHVHYWLAREMANVVADTRKK